MGLGVRADAFERGDVAILHGADLRPAGANRGAADDDRAGAALGKAAAEFCRRELQIVAQRVEQGRVALTCDFAEVAVYAQMVSFRHGGPCTRLARNILRERESVKPPEPI